MTKHLTLAIAGASLAALAVASPAFAHHATVACDATTPKGYRVTADWTHLNPQDTADGSIITVRWSDGYTVRLPLPAGCVAPAPPPPPFTPALPETPQTPEVLPAPAPVPVVGGPPVTTPVEPMGRVTPRTTRHRSVRITRIHACTAAGQRPYVVRLITVTWKRGGKALRVTRTTVRTYGERCSYRVTG